MLKGLDTSAIAYFTALSPVAVTGAGSGTPIDLSAYTHATLVVNTGSTAGAAVAVDVLRSSASNGTFHNFGASINANLLGQKYVRSFTLGSSDVWYLPYRTHTGSGSPVMSIDIVAFPRSAPINQPSGTSSFSVINSA